MEGAVQITQITIRGTVCNTIVDMLRVKYMYRDR